MFTSIKSSGIIFSTFKMKPPGIKPQDFLETVLVKMGIPFLVWFPASPPARPLPQSNNSSFFLCCSLMPWSSSEGLNSGRQGRTAWRWLPAARGVPTPGAPATSHTGRGRRVRGSIPRGLPAVGSCRALSSRSRADASKAPGASPVAQQLHWRRGQPDLLCAPGGSRRPGRAQGSPVVSIWT